MYVTIFKMIRPYLLRYAANYAAERLEARRERRLKERQAEGLFPAPETGEPLRPESNPSAQDAFWFTMSGILLGGALGVGLAHILRQED